MYSGSTGAGIMVVPDARISDTVLSDGGIALQIHWSRKSRRVVKYVAYKFLSGLERSAASDTALLISRSSPGCSARNRENSWVLRVLLTPSCCLRSLSVPETWRPLSSFSPEWVIRTLPRVRSRRVCLATVNSVAPFFGLMSLHLIPLYLI